MRWIRLHYEAKCHYLVERFGPGHGVTACGITIANGISGETAHRQSIDCARCIRTLDKGN